RILDARRVHGVDLVVARGGLERAAAVELHLRDMALARLLHERGIVDHVLARLPVADLHEHHREDDPDHEPDHDGADGVVHEPALLRINAFGFRRLNRKYYPIMGTVPLWTKSWDRVPADIVRRSGPAMPRASGPRLSRMRAAAISDNHHTRRPGKPSPAEAPGVAGAT